MSNYLYGVDGTSLDLSFMNNLINCVIDDKWSTLPIIKKIYYEIYWRLVLRKPFSRACFSLEHIKLKIKSDGDIIFLGNIFRREDVMPILNSLGFYKDKNLFEAFDLSPELCRIRRQSVTDEDIKRKDYENDDIKLSIMARMIPADVKSICDVGCGKRRLKHLLPPGISYIGIDYIQTADDIMTLDLNHDSLPEIITDCIFACGILEFVDDIDKCLNDLIKNKPKYVLLSYSPREYSRISTPRSNVYHNCLYSCQIVSDICSKGYVLTNYTRYESRQVILLFARLSDTKVF